MKDKKITQDEIFERRWLHHAKHESKIFEVDEIRKAMKEGWKFWPWEVEKKSKKVESSKEDKKEEMSSLVIEERDFPSSSNPEVTVINDSVPVTEFVDTISTIENKFIKQELEKCLQKQQPK